MQLLAKKTATQKQVSDIGRDVVNALSARYTDIHAHVARLDEVKRDRVEVLVEQIYVRLTIMAAMPLGGAARTANRIDINNLTDELASVVGRTIARAILSAIGSLWTTAIDEVVEA